MEHQLATKSTQKEQPKNSPSSSPSQTPSAERATTHPVLRLQRAIGNQAVQRMVRSGGIGLQSRPNVNGFGPKAQAPVSPTSLVLQRKCACGGTATSLEATEECAECQAKHDATLQRSLDNQVNSSHAKTAPQVVHDVLSAQGQPLDTGTRAFMETRFGQDFSHVRIHTNTKAAESARAVNALAYTVGRDVVFGAGQYTPGTRTGKQLLAHELTHVVQQSSAQTPLTPRIDQDSVSPPSIQTTLTVSQPDNPYERDAEHVAQHIMRMPDQRPSRRELFVHGLTHTLQSTPYPALQTASSMYLYRAVATVPVQEGSQPPPDSTFWERWGSQIEMLKRMYKEQRYGCWCGPGNVCTEERDNIDACCKRHDLTYDALGVSGSEPGPGQVGMWSIEGLRRTVGADVIFIGCLELTALDPHFYGPVAAAYRSLAQLIFGARATIGLWIRLNIPSSTPIPTVTPVPMPAPSTSNAPQQPLASIPDRAVPMLEQSVAQKARDLISQGHNADALHVIVDALVINGFIDASLCNYKYVARTDQGEGLTNTKYKKDPAGTGQYVPDGLSEVEIYTPAYSSLSWLVSSIMHEYQHVLQHQKMRSPDAFKEPKKNEEGEAGEVEAYLWEIEQAKITGLVNDIPQLWRVANRLTDHYNALGALNKKRQETYRVRYDAAMQFMQDLTGDGPPPLPPYENIFHHATDMETVKKLLRDDLKPLGKNDFGFGFYTHTRENWLKAKEWAIRQSMKKKGAIGWGVLTIPVPDDVWETEMTVALIYQSTSDLPSNAPINPETGRPMDWREFVAYNKKKDREGKLPEWKNYLFIKGPLAGRRISKTQLRQVVFTSSGLLVLNEPELKEQRIAVFRPFRWI